MVLFFIKSSQESIKDSAVHERRIEQFKWERGWGGRNTVVHSVWPLFGLIPVFQITVSFVTNTWNDHTF